MIVNLTNGQLQHDVTLFHVKFELDIDHIKQYQDKRFDYVTSHYYSLNQRNQRMGLIATGLFKLN